jgi:hypothetical protein
MRGGRTAPEEIEEMALNWEDKKAVDYFMQEELTGRGESWMRNIYKQLWMEKNNPGKITASQTARELANAMATMSTDDLRRYVEAKAK